MFKYNEFNISDVIVKNDDRYIVKDNTKLKNLVLSSTALYPGKSTSGHTHKGQEEIYFFVKGQGEMIVGHQRFPVEEGDVVLIPDGAFHQVINTQMPHRVHDTSRIPKDNTLVFNCVFDGSRDQKKNFWNLVVAGIKNRLI
jgi:mannose-6-phosphate isomerase-like protein (cupin superfamily)